MFQLAKAGEAIQTFFQRTAERLARVSGFVQRASKITGAHWIRNLTFGFIETPEATLNQLAQVSTDLGVPVTPQGLEERMTDEIVAFLQAMFGESLKLFRQEHSLPVELLDRFSAVELLDSSVIGLPGSLRISDLGYFNMDTFVQIDHDQAFFLSRTHFQGLEKRGSTRPQRG